jgi:endonuclease/exonuclease/phosphatase family metal-dependent hydrolase
MGSNNSSSASSAEIKPATTTKLDLTMQQSPSYYMQNPEQWKTKAYHIPVFEYNPKIRVWTSTYEPSSLTPSQQQQQTFSTISYNVWFDAYFKQERYEQIFKMCEQYSPDVICFQEATKDFLAQLEIAQWCRDKYVLSDSCGDMRSFSGWYGVVILVKKTVQLKKLMLNTLVTAMSRSCLTVELLVNNQPVQISTVHLESLDSRQIRAHQLRDICTNVFNNNTSILMGDFNFDDEKNWNPNDNTPIENLILTNDPVVSQYKDVWSLLKSNDDPGKSFDSSVNTMIKQNEIMRYDRVIYKSTNNQFTPQHIEMIGNQKFMTVRESDVFPSDHFGLYTVFHLN